MKLIRHIILPILCCIVLVNMTKAQCSFNLSMNQTPVNCNSGTSGAINLTVTGGSGPFTYIWSNGSTTEDLSGLTAGIYTVTVTDALACSATAQVTVLNATPPIADAGPDVALTCVVSSQLLGSNNSSTGPNFAYVWSGPGIAPNNFTLLHPAVNIAGVYTLIVTDNATGCTASDVVLVLMDIIFPSVVIAPPAILNCNVTTITLDGSGSNVGPQYGFFWSTTGGNIVSGANGIQATINAPGTYSLKVTNYANGCTEESSVIVNENVVFPVADAGQDLGIPCGGGTVILNGLGSSIGATFVYNWGGPILSGNTTVNPVVDQPGNYTLIVTDTNNGCTATDAVKVFPGPAIPQQNFTVINVPCLPGQLGAIDMNVNFGSGPYTYDWSNNATTEDIDNLSAGTYTVTVTESNGCSHYACVDVLQGSTTLNLNLSSTNPTCFGASNGTISVTATGGAQPYTFSWSNGGTTGNLINLPPATYVVTVTDAVGCTKTAIRTLQNPVASVQISVVNSTCGANGAANINVIGNLSPPFSFDWSNDGPEDPDNDPEDLTNIGPGTYYVTITAGDGCIFTSGAYVVSGPDPIELTATVIPVPCAGAGNEGAIDLSVSGGVPPYSYHWANGVNTQDLSLLTPGSYGVTVTDANGCSKSAGINVVQGADIPQGDFSATPASCETGATDGAISLNTLPPTAQAPLSFSWQGPSGFSSTVQNITGLTTGDYTLSITDATGCQFFAMVNVGKVPGNLDLMLAVGTSTCTNGTIDLTVTGGTGSYTYVWSNGTTAEDPLYTDAGDYVVTVTDDNGCSKTGSITVVQPIGLSLIATPLNVSCTGGGSNGEINLAVANGTGPYTYLWTNGAVTQNISNLAAGTYCVTVTDEATGCTKTTCAVITQSSPFGASISGTPSTCSSASDGFITVTLLNPGTGPFIWGLAGPSSQSGSSATQMFTINGLASGTYCITITNASGCSYTSCNTLLSPPPIIVNIGELSNTCNAAVIRANITGGVAPFTYAWENGGMAIPETTPAITAPISGMYQVSVLDANGCGNFANITVTLANGGNCGYIKGTVVQDDNENCFGDINEPTLAGWLVRAEGTDTLYGITDATGHYLVGVPSGIYTMKALAPNNLWTVCPNSIHANVSMPNDTAFGGNLPAKRFVQCPALTVWIGTSQLRRCFSSNYYNISYCNEGTAVAQGAYVDVTLDPFLTFVSVNAPFQDMGNNVWRIFIGNVGIGACGTFYIKVAVSCNAVLGQTHCTEAHIFPDTLCNVNPQWSGASLSVRSHCNTDSLQFIIKNVGSGNMNTIVNYIVVEDAVMFMQAPMPLLNVGDSTILTFPANGSTWRVEVGQEMFHPYPQPASLSVEGCTTSNSFSTGYVNQFPISDPQPAVDVDCTANSGSFDPNDKHGYPIGYGAAHYIRPGAEIEYQIRFQNTGTDTAFTVRVIDTLSYWLDPETVRFGASSHPYRYDLCGEGIVQFMFDNIELPDSNVNEAASHGYATFTVTPRANAPLESVIENSAAIYFDYNDPVVTNTTFHRLGENFISVGLWQPVAPVAQVIASPNPFSGETVLEVKGLAKNGLLSLQIYDFQGVELRTMTSEGSVFHLKKSDWPAGIYFFKIMQNDKLVGSGKLIAQ